MKRIKTYLKEYLIESINYVDLNYILDGENHDYYIRYATHIKTDMERNWSSWNFGGGGFEGSYDELVEYIEDAKNNNSKIEISYFELWLDEKTTIKYDGNFIRIGNSKIGELYPNYWTVVDTTKGYGIAGHKIDLDKYNLHTLADIVNLMETNKDAKIEYDGSGDGNFFDAENAKLLYSNEEEGEFSYHIIEV